ncbi:hypothetical protein [Streptomyces sp. NBRC 110028]|uniref:hypothetical protein n=1 Tax=Streptomyces sp. NBRC 110028 TaxID=1621260 RepID=UPI0006E1F745|nr:hypothetical protein [Streptomyces sp. NBRC 110028]
MPEDPIAHHRLAALSWRFEEATEKNDREFEIIKSDMTAVRPQAGNLGQKADRLQARLEDLGQRLNRNQAQIVKLLTGRR